MTMNYKKNDAVGVNSMKRLLIKFSVVALCFGCGKSNVNQKDLRDFKQFNLVANSSEYHPRTVDESLINAFGIAWSPTGIAWVNSVGGHVSELYDAEGNIARHPVNIPAPTDATGGFPCGIVFSGGQGFDLSNGPSFFLFSGFDGVLAGWNPALGDNATRLKAPAGASYTGLAIGSSGGNNFIYAANFGQKRIDVLDTHFSPVSMSFTDPTLPSDYSPYNIQAVGDWLFVQYAVLGADGHPVAGAGKGFVSVFGMDGNFLHRFASQGTLNIPWGVTMAPGSFLEDQDMGVDGKNNSASSDIKGGDHHQKDPVILVGNFGDGRINVFTEDGKFLGQLQSHNQTIVIEGLWALSFPPASANIDLARLYFTAGPDHESDGIFGYLIKN